MKKPLKVILWRSEKDAQFYFKICSANNREIIRSSEGYQRKAGAIKAIKLLTSCNYSGEIVEL